MVINVFFLQNSNKSYNFAEEKYKFTRNSLNTQYL